MNMNWYSNESHVFLNPKAPPLEQINIDKLINEFSLQSHIILATSGSTAINSKEMKFVALSKNAILCSAKAVNEHLLINQKDVLLNALPHFHIGGLSLFARSHLSGAKLINIFSDGLKWDPIKFVKEIESNHVTISSLVPAQIFDLIHLNMESPKSLRAIVVGGGALSKSIFEKAKKLNWPLLPSYGMTECASQIATAPLDFVWDSSFPELKILNHLSVKLNREGNLCVSGESLLTAYIFVKENEYKYIDVKTNLSDEPINNTKYLITSDVGDVNNGYLQFYGRKDEVIKIGGESVSLSRLDCILLDIKSELQIYDDIAILAEKDERLENKISIVFIKNRQENKNFCEYVVSEFNKKVFPFEKIKNTHYVDIIPRTNLGKLQRSLLMNHINMNF